MRSSRSEKSKNVSLSFCSFPNFQNEMTRDPLKFFFKVKQKSLMLEQDFQFWIKELPKPRCQEFPSGDQFESKKGFAGS